MLGAVGVKIFGTAGVAGAAAADSAARASKVSVKPGWRAPWKDSRSVSLFLGAGSPRPPAGGQCVDWSLRTSPPGTSSLSHTLVVDLHVPLEVETDCHRVANCPPAEVSVSLPLSTADDALGFGEEPDIMFEFFLSVNFYRVLGESAAVGELNSLRNNCNL